MSMTDAVNGYKTYIQPLVAKGLRLGAPAVTNSAAPTQGLSWLSQFMGNCTDCTVDFIPIHYYGDVANPSQFTAYVQKAYQMFGKPIWITEFGTTSGSQSDVKAWLSACMSFLDSTSYVERYSYFMDSVGGNLPSGDNWLLASGGVTNALGRAYDSS